MELIARNLELKCSVYTEHANDDLSGSIAVVFQWEYSFTIGVSVNGFTTLEYYSYTATEIVQLYSHSKCHLSVQYRHWFSKFDP